MKLSLFAVLLSSLLGSAHCLGMCGALAASVHTSKDRFAINYHLGRMLTYSLLGAVAGSLGSTLNSVSPHLITVFAVCLVAYGIAGLLGFAKNLTPRWISKLAAKALAKGGRYGPLSVGLLTGFLPCGWMYSFLSIDAILASAINGALVMIAFWLGTVPWISAPAIALRKMASPKLSTAIIYIAVIFSGGMILSEKAYAYFYPNSSNQHSCH